MTTEVSLVERTHAHMRKILLLLAVLSCSRAISEPSDVAPGHEVDLRAGQSAQVSNTSVAVTFDGANDSRCPSDVTCVWAGEALIRLRLSGAGADRTDTVKINAQPRATTYGGYRFEVVSLLPYPVSTAMNATQTLRIAVSAAP